MSVDSALFALAKPIESDQPWPRPACPECQSGYVRFPEPETSESNTSKALRGHDAWEPEWIGGTFLSHGACENPVCGQVVYAAGSFTVDYSKESWGDRRGNSYSNYYTVEQVYPPPLMMPIPSAAPESVKEGIKRASRVLFADPGLAATALRATVELFLTSQGIPATGEDLKFRSAHSRIEEWSDADAARPQVADLLFAVKWLGNAGTHEDSDLTVTEVLDGARVLNEAFHRLFTGPDIDARARSINSAKGPAR